MIEIKKLKKYYKKKCVLDDISLTLLPGIYGLVGPNGAGKSTLMNILSGLIDYNIGEITCDDVFLSDEYYRNLGYLPQYNALYSNFTCYEFLKYIAILKEVNNLERLNEVLKLVNLTSKRNEKIKNLSGGMKQRLAIAQVLLNDPKIILLDEPTAGLDPRERIRLKNILSQLAKNKVIIVSTHIISDMENLADYIILLKKGKIISCKSPKTLIEEVKKYFYEIIIDDEELIESKFQITHIHNQEQGYKIKFIGKVNEPYPHSKNVSLEDVYLYYYGSEDD